MKISQSAFDLIVREEVSSKAYYERHYTHPEWPGGASGITIAIGYDLGYATRAKITADWQALVSPEMLKVMLLCAGITGVAAQQLLPSVKALINIPWDAAINVFANRDIPNWTASVLDKITRADRLTPTCLGVGVSIAYNRGASFDLSGDRYAEMRAIKQHVNANQLTLVAGDLRSMKRLWPTVKGLRDRRDREAALWEAGLSTIEPSAKNVPAAPATPDPDIPLNEGPARTKPPAATKTQNGTTGAVVIGGTIAAQQAHAHGLLSGEVALFIGFLAVLGAITAWWLWYKNRNPK